MTRLCCALFGLALLPACSGDAVAPGGGDLRILVVGDGSFNAARVAKVVLRVDGDGDTVQKELPVSGLPAQLEETYRAMRGGATVVVAAIAYDGAGSPVASGLADPVTLGSSTVEVRVVLRSAGSLADGGSGSDSGSTDGGDVPSDLAGQPPADLFAASDSAACQGCLLGCNALLQRCNRPLPQNYGQVPNEAMFAADVVIAADTLLDTATGKATQKNVPVNLGFVYAVVPGTQPNGAPKLAVFSARSLTLQKAVQLRIYDSASGAPGNAPLFLIAGDIDVSGTLDASGLVMSNGSGRRPAPGGFPGSTSDGPGGGPAKCGGVSGNSNNLTDDGGGGGAASGGKGGNGAKSGSAVAGAGGSAVFLSQTPLFGGCGGGSGSARNGHVEGGGGGGALQLSAGGTLTVAAGAVIHAGGNGGLGGTDTGSGGGGGSGGMIVLEGAVVTLAVGSLVAANGGGGGGGGNGLLQGGGQAGQPGPAAIAGAAGGSAKSAGGGGGWQGAPDGKSAPAANSVNGGGGGGGVGLLFTVAGKANVADGTRSAIHFPLVVTTTY
ncbi:MAG: hypothetical protein EXR72_18145 [Myxococcales bacterium]|nr:hypothetical protein [Myxococcales bacterium]